MKPETYTEAELLAAIDAYMDRWPERFTPRPLASPPDALCGHVGHHPTPEAEKPASEVRMGQKKHTPCP